MTRTAAALRNASIGQRAAAWAGAAAVTLVTLVGIEALSVAPLAAPSATLAVQTLPPADQVIVVSGKRAPTSAARSFAAADQVIVITGKRDAVLARSEPMAPADLVITVSAARLPAVAAGALPVALLDGRLPRVA